MEWQEVLSSLDAVREGGRPGLWSCRCPCKANHSQGDRRPSGRVWVDDAKDRLCCWCAKGCRWKEWLAATGTSAADWFRVADRPPGQHRKGRKVDKVVATYDYTDERGTLLYQVCRTEPKGFFQRKPQPKGAPGTWDMNLGDVRRVPYHLPELIDEKKKTHPVLIAEGEGKVDLLREMGFVATCAAGGAGKWPVMFGGFLVGRRVVIFPDLDDVGMEHAMRVAASAIWFGADSVRVVRYGMGWDSMPAKSDVKDWIKLQPAFVKPRDELIKLIKLQPEWAPKAMAA